MWLLESYQFIGHLVWSNEIMDLSLLNLSKDQIGALQTFTVIFPATLLTYIVTFVRMRMLAKHLKVLLIEFFLLVIPMLLNVTVLVETVLQVIVFALTVLACFITSCCCARMSKKAIRRVNAIAGAQQRTPHLTFVTNARATINLLTAIAILAVDFKVFPANFGKTKKYGFSLMDVGVGLFMYSNGIVAPKRQESFVKTIKGTVFLLILGVGRYLITKQINYHVSVWEYGVHWNFFITLAIIRIFSALLIKLIGDRHLFIIAPLLLTLHETLLQFGLADFVFGPGDRKSSFIVANREGIVSSLGYIALYLFSVPIGHLLKDNSGSKRLQIIKITALSLALVTATFTLNYFFQTSRTLANSSYCCWTLFLGVFMTNTFYLCEWVQRAVTGCKYIPPSLLSEAINYNGLLYFLTCNLLTGFVNLVFKTRRMPPVNSLVILGMYMIVNCALMVGLWLKKWRLKL